MSNKPGITVLVYILISSWLNLHILPADGGEQMTSVRVYLGMEYECPRGHRFFCSGPDKVIKVSSNSIVKVRVWYFLFSTVCYDTVDSD